MKRNAGRTISAAYQSGNAVRAKRMLEALARQLERKHPAAASLREGLGETLTVMPIDLEARLARTLSTANPINFINGRIRRTTRNVAKWDGGTMVIAESFIAPRSGAIIHFVRYPYAPLESSDARSRRGAARLGARVDARNPP